MADNGDFKKIGAGWKKTSKAGNNYLSIQFDAQAIQGLDLTQMNVMIFPVKEKKNPKSPDYNVNATEKQQHQQSAPQPTPQAAPPQPVPRPQVKNFAPPANNGWEDGDDF